MTPRLPNVQPGEPILPAFQDLVRYERATQLASGFQVRRRQHADGTALSVDVPAQLWLHPWKVLISDREATVRLGTVNAVVPTIRDIPLDDPVQPRLRITGSPGQGLRSWILLRIMVNEAGQIDPETPAAAVILHSTDSPLVLNAAADPRVSHHPLALIVWQSRTVIGKVHACTHHNLAHYWIKPEGTAPAQHLFWAV